MPRREKVDLWALSDLCKDRSLAEFRALARSANLEVHAAQHQPSGRFVVECRPRG